MRLRSRLAAYQLELKRRGLPARSSDGQRTNPPSREGTPEEIMKVEIAATLTMGDLADAARADMPKTARDIPLTLLGHGLRMSEIGVGDRKREPLDVGVRALAETILEGQLEYWAAKALGKALGVPYEPGKSAEPGVGSDQ